MIIMMIINVIEYIGLSNVLTCSLNLLKIIIPLIVFLTQEVVAALEGGCNIIPVMDNFQWPSPDTLPEDMRPICYFNSIR